MLGYAHWGHSRGTPSDRTVHLVRRVRGLLGPRATTAAEPPLRAGCWVLTSELLCLANLHSGTEWLLKETNPPADIAWAGATTAADSRLRRILQGYEEP